MRANRRRLEKTIYGEEAARGVVELEDGRIKVFLASCLSFCSSPTYVYDYNLLRFHLRLQYKQNICIEYVSK